MKLFLIIFLSILPAFVQARGRNGVEPKGIQVIVEGDDCKTLPSDNANKGGLHNQDTGEDRCARTLFPPDNSYKYLEDITYTFWKCGLGSKDGWSCGISRIVTVPADSNQAVAIGIDEYLSEDACNANCMQEADDKCWVCVDSTNGNGWTHYYCKHRADLSPFLQNASGTTKIGCLKTCSRLEELPYELMRYP